LSKPLPLRCLLWKSKAQWTFSTTLKNPISQAQKSWILIFGKSWTYSVLAKLYLRILLKSWTLSKLNSLSVVILHNCVLYGIMSFRTFITFFISICLIYITITPSRLAGSVYCPWMQIFIPFMFLCVLVTNKWPCPSAIPCCILLN
jgi:hypothetical protein